MIEPNAVDRKEALLEVEGTVINIDIKVLIDTWASKNYISEELVNKYKLKVTKARESKPTVLGDGRIVNADRVINVNIQLKAMEDTWFTIESTVMKGLPNDLILVISFFRQNNVFIDLKSHIKSLHGREINLNCKKFESPEKIISDNLMAIESQRLEKVIEDCKEKNRQLGRPKNVEHSIELTRAPEIREKISYNLPHAAEEALQRETCRLTELES